MATRTYLRGMQKLLIIIGLLLILTGLAWPLLQRMFGNMPGDVHWGGDGWSVHILLGTSIVLSIVLTVVLNFVLWWMNR